MDVIFIHTVSIASIVSVVQPDFTISLTPKTGEGDHTLYDICSSDDSYSSGEL
jgi:hypothetical protein